MALDLLDPEYSYKSVLKDKHHETVLKYFDELTKQSRVDAAANKATCERFYNSDAELQKLNKKAKRMGVLKGFLIFLCILIIGIPFYFALFRPKYKVLLKSIEELSGKTEALKNEAYAQMAPLNSLFDSTCAAKLMEKTVPLIQMDRIFDVKKYELMKEKYGFWDNSDEDCSTLDLQSGTILGNPFVFFKDMKKEMIMETYRGSITISYYTGSGNNRRLVTQTLTATVEKPKPVYSKETYLVYCNEAANHLSFSRVPSEINKMDDEKIEKYVRKHEGDLQKMAEKAAKKGGNYTPLGNSEFELFFGGLDRDNEVEYRLLFTPLAQKSMLNLLKSKVGYGDDFVFNKIKGVNVIQSAHSQGESVFMEAEGFFGFDYELIKERFVEYNDNFFKAVFFDFAPLLSIPLYQQYKSREYIYKNNVPSNYVCFEHEILANKFDPARFTDKESNTPVILKTSLAKRAGNDDIITVTGHSFKTIDRIETVSKLGGDGRFHSIPVHWTEYIPVEGKDVISVSDLGIDNEVKFRGLNQEGVIYAKGLVSTGSDLNVDINKLKSLMEKD